MRRIPFMMALAVAPGLAAAGAAQAESSDEALAQRFRPYVAATGDEQYRPASWQWMARHSHYRNGDNEAVSDADIEDVTRLLAPTGADLRSYDPTAGDPGLILELRTEDDRHGQEWSSAVKGSGIYAHVERVADDLVNIEYTVTWAYNDGASDHDGDMTTFVVVYNRRSDLLQRLFYSIHGCMYEAYDLTPISSAEFATLSGTEPLGQPRDTAVLRVNVSDGRSAMATSGYCSAGAPRASDAFVMLAKDPVSGLYEHPVAIYEEGSHENWPNNSGNLTGSNKDGGGVAFLPDAVTFLGSVDAPNPDHEAFLFYNGKFGDDPQAIALHKTFYWPGGREVHPFAAQHVAPWRFSDADTYTDHGDLEWPPAATSPAAELFVVPDAVSDGDTFTGRQDDPFPALDVALSLAPAGSRVRLAPGVYRQALRLGRPLLLQADGGPATLRDD